MMNENGPVSANSEIILNIKSHMQQMNPAQTRIARYILEHPNRVEGLSIGDFAKESRVSEATISRFVKFLGCANYRGFQAEIVKSNLLSHEKIRGYAGVEEMNDIYQISQNIFDTNIQCLLDTLSVLDCDVIDNLAGMIVKSRKLCVFAQGRSVVTATSIKHRLHRLGISCCIFSDSHEQAMSAALMKENDVVMGISTYGRSRTVLKNLRIAASKGATVVGVSSYKGTPLEEICDIMLITSSNEETSFGFEPSCATVAQMVTLDCLYILITKRMKDEATECFRLTCEAIESERE